MAMSRTLVTLTLLLAIINPAFSQSPPCVYPRMDQVIALVRARVARSASGFQYHYLIRNGPAAKQVLNSFAIDAFATRGARVIQMSPAAWVADGPITDTSFQMWSVQGPASRLTPNMEATGFGFADGDLPAIVKFLAWGEVEPPRFEEGQAPDSCENADIIKNSFKGTTVAPKPPAQLFVPVEFLNYLITLVRDSRQLGWIEVDGVQQSLLAKLLNAKRKLEAGDITVAKNMLNAFLHEVQGASCPEFTCPGNKPLTSEAFALLFFNGQFLVERLR